MESVKQSILNRAIIEAARSSRKQRVGCVIFKGNTIISTGFNELRHCRLLPIRYKKWFNSLHAEQRAIIYSKQELKRCSLLVVRLSYRNELVLAKPCDTCLGLIKDSEIKRVFYTTKQHRVEELKI